MATNHYHLAQINVGRMIAPLDSPVLADFVAQLDHVNALADASPGFVWRLKDATSVQAFADPQILVNMSVWESAEQLREYAYRSGHREPLRDRLKWFERPKEAHLALWWIPAGHIPTVEEARDRLEFRRAHGDTPVSFSFAKPFPQPDEPTVDPVAPPVNFDKRVFRTSSNTPNGDVDAATRFMYHQDGARIWATYSGGHVRFGSVVAAGASDGKLDLRYHHVDAANQFRPGRCITTPEVLADGRLRLHEEWQWTNGDLSQGRAVIEEIR